MNTSFRGSFAVPALLAAALATPVMAQQDAAGEAARLRADIERIRLEVRRAEDDIRRTDSLARAEREAAERGRERLERDRERRERENAALEARVRDTRARVAAERAREAGHGDGITDIRAREKAVLEGLAAVADSLLARVESGLPWDTEARRDRMLSLKRDLEAGAAAPEEGFARLHAVLREEVRGGDEVTLLSRPLTRGTGEVINAQILRLGNQGAVYVDDEGKKFGILEPREEGGKLAWTWREDLDLGERSAVRRAVAVKAGREAPQLVPLPFSLAGVARRDAVDATSAAAVGKGVR